VGDVRKADGAWHRGRESSAQAIAWQDRRTKGPFSD
jgi:hypothetical protein